MPASIVHVLFFSVSSQLFFDEPQHVDDDWLADEQWLIRVPEIFCPAGLFCFFWQGLFDFEHIFAGSNSPFAFPLLILRRLRVQQLSKCRDETIRHMQPRRSNVEL